MAIENIPGLPPGSGRGGTFSQPKNRARAAFEGRPAPASRQEQVEPKVDAASVKCAAEEINEQLRMAARNIRFAVDEQTGEAVVRVVDAKTGKLIREVAAEEVTAMSRSPVRLQGVLFDQEA